MNIFDFEKQHVEEAKTLALANYFEEKTQVPILPEVKDLPAYGEFIENGLGVAALEEGKLVGFLCCANPREKYFRSQARGIFSPLHGHGALQANQGMIYKKMYQAAAEKWVKAGIAYHGLALYAHDHEAVNSMFTYGFGLRCIDAIRPLEMIGMPVSPGIHFEELAREDAPQIQDLRRKLIQHLGKSPCFMVFTPEEIVQSLTHAEAADTRLFVAKADGQPVAYAEISAKGENFATEGADMGNITGAYCLPEYRGQYIYSNLLNFVMSTLKTEGYVRIGVDFESFNGVAHGFWLKYFTPYTYSLVRRIDECALRQASLLT